MKWTLILTFFLLTPIVVNSRNLNDILGIKETKKARYILKTDFTEAIVINMSFGESSIVSTANKEKLKKADIIEVHVVYSDFPKGIDMTDLNHKRILKALELRDDLVNNEAIDWSLIRQTGCSNEAEANTLFHGIVIIYRPVQDKELMKRDIDLMYSFLPPIESKEELKQAVKALPDTSVLKIFNRNKHWTNMTVAVDVTGSMYPYISQVALWFKLHEKDNEIKHVIAFNDGDSKDSREKITGKTGGIYSGSPKSFDEAKELLVQAMRKGGGGDCQENDIEALLHAQSKFATSQELILIADNMAPLRDFDLIKELKIPVRVVLCGTHFGVNLQYMQLAYATGGSIHTMEKDLYDLLKLKDGSVITLGSEAFKIVGGTIIQLKKI